jgi:hypothetical protein
LKEAVALARGQAETDSVQTRIVGNPPTLDELKAGTIVGRVMQKLELRDG